jgi:spoIIIJ-associated protein
MSGRENEAVLPPAIFASFFEDSQTMPIEDHAAAANKIAAFLQTLIKTGGLRVKYRITAGGGAVDPDGLEAREIYVELAGPDAPLVTERGGELLRALEHIASKIIRLEPEEHDKVSFDANQFKALRARELRMTAETAAESVRRTGQPFSFAPMSSRERRMLHLALKDFEDIETASSGEGLGRFVVAYPKGSPLAKAAASETRRGPRGFTPNRGFGGRSSGRGGRGDRPPRRRD